MTPTTLWRSAADIRALSATVMVMNAGAVVRVADRFGGATCE
jgi:hypothetical protein